VGVGGELVSLKLRPADGNDVVVSPWPFREPLLTVGVAARWVPHREYTSDDDFRQALTSAEAVTLRYLLRPG
jgi:hypothetical protein